MEATKYLRKLANNNPQLSTLREIAALIERLEKEAELGRLATQTTGTICHNDNFKRCVNRCERNNCHNYKFCKERSKLIAEMEAGLK